MVAANPSASISFDHAKTQDAKVPGMATHIKMEDIHAVETMHQDASSGPITAHEIERCVNSCSHSSRHRHRICPTHQAKNKHRGRLGHGWNTITNASYFDDALEFTPSDRGSDDPSVPSTFSKPLRDAYPVNWFDWICRNIE